MSRDTTNFRVVDLDSCDFSDLSPLDIEETVAVRMTLNGGEGGLLDVMGAHMRDGPEQ